MSGILLSSVGASYSSAPTTIGQAYGGGYYAGKISTTANGVATHYLIVAPKSSGQATKQWKTDNNSTPGAPTSDIDGPANSALMNNSLHPAAQFCEGLTIGGYSDWYMPAKDELEVCYYFLKPTTFSNGTNSGSNPYAVSPEPSYTNYSSSSPAQTSATIFKTGNSEAFNDIHYWTSTEFPTSNAKYQIFMDGYQDRNLKTTSYYVRAVRRVPV